jgi:hypothetical protein
MMSISDQRAELTSSRAIENGRKKNGILLAWGIVLQCGIVAGPVENFI